MNPVKFRCYRCNQLLGVSRQKIGEVVACPRCLAELVVPDPDESDAPQSAEDTPGAGGSAISPPIIATDPPPQLPEGMTDAGLPLDVLSLRPEDIGVEPGALQIPRTTAHLSPTPVTVVMPAAALRPGEPVPAVVPQPASPAPAVPETPGQAGVPLSIPPISIDGPTRKSLRASPVTVRSRDLVLPRSVVASWSLFVLLALAFAFLAGLLAGHYIWRVH